MRKIYIKDKGYCDLDNVDNIQLRYKIDIVKKLLLEHYNVKDDTKVLIAGCGDGREAIYFKEMFNNVVIGADINIPQKPLSNNNVSFLRADLLRIPLKNNSIDIIYCYHVLEHVENPIMVLEDLTRVLKKQSVLFIGFPNKNRILAYINPHNDVTLFEKIKWNLNDYKMRLSGKFDNKYGAHAGFTEKFFLKEANKLYNRVYCVRNNYMLYKYSKYKFLLILLIKLKLSEFIFPSNYYICIK